jgi:conjugative transfer signal peptidase TraF
MAWKPPLWLIWNASASVPIGLYRVQSSGKLMVNDLAIVMPPEPVASLLAEGGYLLRGVPLVKHVLALAGQRVCRKGLDIILDGNMMGIARERDHRGRPLPNWQGCHVLADGDVFLMNLDQPASLDGRYFRLLPVSSIVGRASKAWVLRIP